MQERERERGREAQNDSLWTVITIMVLMTSYVPISSEIELSGATRPMY